MKTILLLLLAALAASAQTAVFPGAIATNTQLTDLADRAQTTLNAPLNASATSFTVVSGSKFAANMILTIDSEQIKIWSVVGNTVHVGHSGLDNIDGRGFSGTAAASHANNALVSNYIVSYQFKALREEIKAVETALGASMANVPQPTYPIAVNKGGTAATTAAAARTALGAAASGANADVTSLTALSTPLSIGQGGTGAATQAAALAAVLGSSQVGVANGGTGTATVTGVLLGAGTGAFSGVTGSQLQRLRVKPNQTSTIYEFADPASVYAADYNFPSQSPGGSLAIGANTITLTPCPLGSSGADVAHSVYISGGTGAAEAVLITGGTCTSGSATGTLIVTAANTHTGAWTVTSIAAGLQEAICALPTAGGSVDIAAANLTLLANVTACGKTTVSANKPPGMTISGAFTVLGSSAFDATITQRFSNATPAGNWSSLAGGIYPYHRTDVNSFPLLHEFQGGVTSTVVGVDGAVNGGSAGPGAILGVSGYAQTNFASAGGGTAAVGVFGAGYIGFQAPGGQSTQSWGANFVSNNCNGVCGDGNGFNLNNSYGLEIDVNMFKTATAALSTNAQGLWIAGASTHQPTGISEAVHVGALGQFTAPQVPWKFAFHTDNGAALSGIKLGTIDTTANPSGCQGIQLNSRSAGGVAYTSTIDCDQYGNFIFRSGAAVTSGIVWQDAAGTALASTGSYAGGAQFVVNNVGLQITGGTAPTCDAAHRGEFIVNGAAHTAGVKDSVQVCAADAANAYAFRTIY